MKYQEEIEKEDPLYVKTNRVKMIKEIKAATLKTKWALLSQSIVDSSLTTLETTNMGI